MKSLLVFIVAYICTGTATTSEDFSFIDCCGYPDPSINNKQKLQICSPSVGQNDTQQIENLSCQMACILKEMDLLIDDVINIEKYHKIIDNTMAHHDEAKQFYNTKLDECRTKIDEYEKHHSFENFSFNKKCSMKNFAVMLCFTSVVAIECPDGEKVKSDECDAQRNNLQRLLDEFIKE